MRSIGLALAFSGWIATPFAALSIHLIKGEFTQPNDKTSPLTFTGDVSIRTRPRSELVEGSSREQMMKAPLRLDVQDALVVLTQRR